MLDRRRFECLERHRESRSCTKSRWDSMQGFVIVASAGLRDEGYCTALSLSLTSGFTFRWLINHHLGGCLSAFSLFALILGKKRSMFVSCLLILMEFIRYSMVDTFLSSTPWAYGPTAKPALFR